MGKNFSTKAFLFCYLLWPCAIVAQSQSADVGEQSLVDESVVEHSGVNVRVKTAAGGNCRFSVEHRGARETKHFTMPSPNRLVVDLQGLRINRSKELSVKANPCVKAVRFGVQPSGTRVVFDLQIPATPTYQALVGENSFEASLAMRGAVSGVNTSAAEKPAEPKPVQEKTQPELERPKDSEPAPLKEKDIKEKDLKEQENNVPPAPQPALPPAPVPSPVPPQHEISAAVTAAKAIETSTTASLSGQSAEPALKIVGEPVLKFKVAQVFVALAAERRAVEDISVTNTSEERLNMTAQVRKLIDAGLPTEREVETKEMLVSPMFFSLEAGAERQVRIVSVNEAGESEAAYRVRFAPQRGGFEPEATLNVGDASARLNVITALAVLVVRAPEKRRGELVSVRRDGGILLRNESNQSLGLSEVKLCETRSRNNCREVPGRRLFPGNEWFIDSLGQGTLEFLKRSSSDFEMVVLEGEAR